MNEITYLSRIQESHPIGQKPAKISQEKIARLKANYKKNLQAISPSVVENAPVEAPMPVVNEVASTPVVQQETVVAPLVMDNYEDVSKNFQMTGYKKSFDELPLVAARKIRTANKVPKHIKGYKRKLATGMLENVQIVERTVSSNPIQEERKETVVNVVVESPKVQLAPITNEHVQRETVSPSVDDYLQKEVPNNSINVLIKQQEEKNANLSSVKEEKLRKLQQIREKKEQFLQEKMLADLREEELGLTTAIEGIDAQILREEAELMSMGRGR